MKKEPIDQKQAGQPSGLFKRQTPFILGMEPEINHVKYAAACCNPTQK